MEPRTLYEALPGRVVFGWGSLAAVPDEVAHLGGRRVLVVDGLQDTARADSVAEALGHAYAGTLDGTVQHVPVEVVAAGREAAEAARADCLVALGGGSATGLAKAIALETGLPIVAVPTTYAGSEMTPIWGTSSGGRKTTGSDPAVLPRTVVYDPELTLSLPPGATAASGMNAMAHCVEALWTQKANPVTDAIATDGIRLLAEGLRACVTDPADRAGREQALRGAWLGGTALAVAGTALHHKVCHVLGGFGLPHAEVHAAVLPWVVDFLAPAAPQALERVARALDADDAVAGLQRLAGDLGLSAGLAELGLRPEQLPLAAELVEDVAPAWPAPVTRADVRSLLEHAMTTSARA